MANMQTGEIKNWDDLTPEQRASGDWFKLPCDAGEVTKAKQRSPAERFFASIPVKKFDATEYVADAMKQNRGSFDATGKPNV